MKKYLFLMLALVGIMFSFTSCSSDDDDATSLKGTIWVNFDEDEGLRTLTFGEKEFYGTLSHQGNTQTENGTYTYEPPFVKLTYTDKKTKKQKTETGKIEGKTLKVNNIVYTKQ